MTRIPVELIDDGGIRIELDGTQEAIEIGVSQSAVDIDFTIQVTPLRIVERVNTGVNFSQDTPSTVWTINHGLGFRPIVQACDPTGNVIVAAIHHVDLDTCQVIFNNARVGTARAI